MFRLVPEVHHVVQQCHPCQVKDQRAAKQKDFHRPGVQAGAPFQVWSMDIWSHYVPVPKGIYISSH